MMKRGAGSIAAVASKMVADALRIGDLMIQNGMRVVTKIAELGAKFADTVKEKFENLSQKDVVEFLKMLPIIGDVI